MTASLEIRRQSFVERVRWKLRWQSFRAHSPKEQRRS
jgi:hypothetical protein